MARISGRHAQVRVASPHQPTAADDNNPKLTARTAPAAGGDWVDTSEWIRSIDLNGAGATEQVTGLNKLAHQRHKLLYDLTGTLNGTIGTVKDAGTRVTDHATAPIDGDESQFIFANAANSDDSYDLDVVFGPTGNRVRLLAEVLFTSYNVQRGDDASLRFTADFELAGGEPAVWDVA